MGSFRQGLNKVLRSHNYQLIKLDAQPTLPPETINELEAYRSRDDWHRFCERLVLTALKALTQSVVDECDSHGIDAKDWALGVEDELRYWWDVMSENLIGTDNEQYRKSFLLEFPFQYEEELPDNADGGLDILDIGCALKPAIGRLNGNRKLNIMAVDPLAQAYNVLMDIYGVDRGYDLVFGVAEKTAELFGRERFDFILAQNSIDHGYAPMQAFEQICAALKAGGTARFQHFENEAVAQDYMGFHQWNIEMHDGSRLRVWNRETSQIVDFGAFGCEAVVEEFRYDRFGTEETAGINVRVKKGPKDA